MRSALLFLSLVSLFTQAQDTKANTGTPSINTHEVISEEVNNENLDDLMTMDLEDLMNVTVTSVSKKEENSFKAPSAIYVITQDDLEKRKVKNLAEALRGAPGVQVSRRSTDSWEVSIRGFDNQFSNKLLVLIDGRTVYTPVFAGVYWDITHTPIEDVERIEIIRGPGATLWGSNAVNGVINITTKHASKTTGGLLSLDYGTNYESNYFRYGQALDENESMFLRAYGETKKYYSLDSGSSSSFNDNTHDNWDSLRGGLRFDWKINSEDSIRISSDAYHQKSTSLDTLTGTPLTFDYESDGFNIITEFTRQFSQDESLSIQAYYDFYRRATDNSLNTDLHTWDLNSTYHFKASKNHAITLGGGMRVYYSQLEDPSGFLNITPVNETTYNFNAFIQDKITLVEDRVSLTLGSKFEENDYTNFDAQPSARLAYTPDDKHTFWAAISRAIRTPNRYENSSNLLFGAAVGNEKVEPEELIAYELGYRVLINERTSLDFTTFYNDYSNLVTTYTIPPQDPIINDTEANSYGFEVAANYFASYDWQIKTSYSYFDIDMDVDYPDNQDLLPYDNVTANHKAGLHSYYSINEQWDWNSSIFYTDSRSTETPGQAGTRTPAYIRLDSGLNWVPKENLNLSLTGYNLLDSSTQEANNFAEVPRSVQFGLKYEF